MNLFAVFAGTTSKARKGTSWGRIRQYTAHVEPDWMEKRVQGGLASGEGMVYAVRDEVVKKQAIKGKGGRIEAYQDVVGDHGEPDKRLLCVEEEYAGVLRMIERQGNSLSQRLREAWQGRAIGSMTKNSQTKCTEPRISLIGHATIEEIRRYLSATEMANGFGNRHLWFCVKRSKKLPDGGPHEPAQELLDRLMATTDFAISVSEMKRDAQAREKWHAVYGDLSEGKPGLAGAMMGRAEAQVMRLACVYALLDCSFLVWVEHLNAALALWDYCEASVIYIFGDATGNPIADDILRALRAAPDGLTRTEISKLFSNNRSANQIGQALKLLFESKLATFETTPTGGAPVERWRIRDKRG